jgi:hypothetical protein
MLAPQVVCCAMQCVTVFILPAAVAPVRTDSSACLWNFQNLNCSTPRVRVECHCTGKRQPRALLQAVVLTVDLCMHKYNYNICSYGVLQRSLQSSSRVADDVGAQRSMFRLNRSHRHTYAYTSKPDGWPEWNGAVDNSSSSSCATGRKLYIYVSAGCEIRFMPHEVCSLQFPVHDRLRCMPLHHSLTSLPPFWQTQSPCKH